MFELKKNPFWNTFSSRIEATSRRLHYFCFGGLSPPFTNKNTRVSPDLFFIFNLHDYRSICCCRVHFFFFPREDKRQYRIFALFLGHSSLERIVETASLYCSANNNNNKIIIQKLEKVLLCLGCASMNGRTALDR